MVEISGAVRHSLSGFDALSHFLGHNNPRAIPEKMFYFQKALVAPIPLQNFGWGKKYYTVFKDLTFFSFLFLLYISLILFIFCISLSSSLFHNGLSRYIHGLPGQGA